ncbi:ERCC4 domain-containing protein [Archaeoglobus veneficus]|uniref:Cyclic nucleotide-binding protein n=1 Tax=Archaeoglobus veneficus (strain DSM 11195 / SNP6) TaxID=693661 RepID=F2KPA1_ARCVS|nr:ERCC4 domain-containing protein [Archaeoglobus veneficus]AEA47505.1 cyclic nucleotide-binding protein [Archaeoglobus veneficus SNP6]
MIFADDREPERIVEALQSMGITVRKKRLEVGDYLIIHGSYAVAVERKDADDYVSSIVDGRLFDQLHRLANAYELSFLCIVGKVDFSRIRKEAFTGSLVSIALKSKGSVIPLRTDSEEEFCLVLKSINRQVEEGKLKTVPRIVKKASVEDSVAMLTAIPGIGVEKAKRLLEKFGSVYRVVNATIPELMRVEGIGEKQAKRIYYFVRGKRVK